jgi:hypothetical protein
MHRMRLTLYDYSLMHDLKVYRFNGIICLQNRMLLIYEKMLFTILRMWVAVQLGF